MALFECGGGAPVSTGIFVAFDHRAGNDRSGCVVGDFTIGEFTNAGPTQNAVTNLQTENITMKCAVASVSGSTNSLVCKLPCKVYSENGTLLGTFAANDEIIGSSVAPATTGFTIFYLVTE